MFSIGKRLKHFRIKNKYSVKDVCELLCTYGMPICIKTIYKWEDDSIMPDLNSLNALANIYNTHIGMFFGDNFFSQALDEYEEIFINTYRNNDTFKKIIFLLTKQDKEEKYNENKFIN